MTSRFKKSTTAISIFFVFYILNGMTIMLCQARATESIQLSNVGSVSLQQNEQSTKPSIIEYFPGCIQQKKFILDFRNMSSEQQTTSKNAD